MSGLGLDTDQVDAAQDVLDGLERELERHIQRPLQNMERTELVYPDEAGRLWPKATPITSITSPAGLLPNGGNGLTGTYVVAPSLMWGGGYEPVTLVYTGGLAGEDEKDVKLAIMRAAAREVTVRHDDTLSVADLEERNTQPVDRQPLGFTDAELKKFDRLRRRTVV